MVMKWEHKAFCLAFVFVFASFDWYVSIIRLTHTLVSLSIPPQQMWTSVLVMIHYDRDHFVWHTGFNSGCQYSWKQFTPSTNVLFCERWL